MHKICRLIKKAVFSAAAVLLVTAMFSGCAGNVNGAAKHSDQSTVRMNEVMSSNSYFAALPDGSCCDWVEIYNDSDESVDLQGYGFSDDTSRPRKWVVPESCMVEAGGYLVIYMSGMDCVDEQGNLHTSFRLSSDGETLLMSNSDGALVQMLELPACAVENISYGIDERTEKEEYVWMAEPSPGRECKGDTAKSAGDLEFKSNGIIINEYMSNNSFTIYDRDSEYSDWIEFYNPTEEDVSLAGCSLSDDGITGERWFFPDDAMIKSKDYLVVFCSGKQSDDSGELHSSFRLSGEDSSLTFFSASGQPMLSVDLIELPENVSYGIEPVSGEWKLFSQSTPGRENNTYAYAVDAAIKGSPSGDVIISEIMAVSSGIEEDTLTRDYIELYNTASQKISLSGFGLSEDAEGAEFLFPDVTIGAGEYLKVSCTGKDNTKGYSSGELTAAFKLGQGGQTVYLYDQEGHIVDIFESGKQTYGVSRGRLPGDLSRWHYFSHATPGAENMLSDVIDGYTPLPEFSVNGGFVDAGFVLHIDSAEDCKVYYTTDGSMPSESSDVYRHADGIKIYRTTVVKAIAASDGKMMSEAVTATFFVDADHSLSVVSLSVDPVEMFSEQYGIYSDRATLVASQINYNTDIERQCSVEYYVNQKKAVSFNAGVRIFGGGSRGFTQKSLALILREKYGANEISFPFFEDNEVTVFSALVLRQAGQECQYSKLRDELMARIVKNQVNCDYMDMVPVALYINGNYWGLYYIREKLNEDYLAHKYGYDKDNIDIIKYERNASAGTTDDYNDLLSFAEKNDLTKAQNYKAICDRVSIESLIDYWICETFCANNDTGNIRAYRHRTADCKWGWMLFDVDNGFYQYLLYENSIYEHLLDPEGHGMNDGCSNVLIRKLLENSEFRAKFVSRYCYHLKNTFAPERTLAMLDELSGQIRPEMPAQFERWGMPSEQTWEKHLQEVTTFLEKRPEVIAENLKQNFQLSDAEFRRIYNAA